MGFLSSLMPKPKPTRPTFLAGGVLGGQKPVKGGGK